MDLGGVAEASGDEHAVVAGQPSGKRGGSVFAVTPDRAREVGGNLRHAAQDKVWGRGDDVLRQCGQCESQAKGTKKGHRRLHADGSS